MTAQTDPSLTPDDRTGQTLAGRYVLESLIGVGGMSSVYRAEDSSLGRTVAIKMFSPALASADDLRRQQDEVRMLAALNHPSLVTLFDAVADDDGRAFLVLEFVEGDDLRERLIQDSVDINDTVAIGIDIASALSYVHERGVVHRDIKPGNILVTASSTVPGALAGKLADFGIARLIDAARITMTGSVLGTASYLSPEQALGHHVTSASDIYSLGLVLLECLTGEKSFPGNGVEAAIARLSRDPVIPDNIEPRVAQLLSAMTAREPLDRPTAAEVTTRLRDLAVAGLDADIRGDRGLAAEYDPTIAMPVADETAVMTASADADATAAMTGADTTAAMTATTVMPTPTMRFPGTPATPAISVTQTRPPKSAPISRPRDNRMWLVAAGIAAALVVVAIAVSSNATLSPSPTPTAPAIEYPAVEGTLGEHLTILQESVAP